MRRTDVPTDLDTGPRVGTASQADVEDGDIGPGCRDPLQGFLAGRRFADHDDVVFGGNQIPHAATHELVIVEEEDACGHGFMVSLRCGGAA